jgi:hypothetical protein
VRVVRWRPARARVTVLISAIAALALGTLVLTGDSGVAQSVDLRDENSWLRIQNVGTSAAAIEIDFYDNAGARVAQDTCPRAGVCAALRPGFGRSFFQQTLSTLPDGYRGSAYVNADQPFVALLARDVLRTDGTFQIAGDALRLGPGVARHALPWVANTFDQVSRIVVENTSTDTSACAQILYYREGGGTPTVDPSVPSPGCPNGGQSIGPRASWVRDEHSLPVLFGFDGAALVVTQPTSSGLSAASQQLAVVVDTRDRSRAGLATYRSVTSEELSQVVLLPMVDRNATEGGSTVNTRFRIVSEQPNVPNEVKLLFQGVTGTGAEYERESTITVLGARTCDQRATGSGACLPAGEQLPSTFYGTVRMQAVNPVAVVVQRASSDGSLADYRGFTADEASTQVVLPVVNKNYGPFGGASGWNSWFRVQTWDGSAATVYVIYYSARFPDGLFPPAPTVVRGSHTFRQWQNIQLPNGWVGSAAIVADRPIVVVANLESDVFTGDPVMLYNGVALE